MLQGWQLIVNTTMFPRQTHAKLMHALIVRTSVCWQVKDKIQRGSSRPTKSDRVIRVLGSTANDGRIRCRKFTVDFLLLLLLLLSTSFVIFVISSHLQLQREDRSPALGRHLPVTREQQQQRAVHCLGGLGLLPGPGAASLPCKCCNISPGKGMCTSGNVICIVHPFYAVL